MSRALRAVVIASLAAVAIAGSSVAADAKKQASGRKGGRYRERRKRALGKAKFRFVNTHLEAISAFYRAEQASELLASGALDRAKQTILVGDLNSDPDDPDVQGPRSRPRRPPMPPPTTRSRTPGSLTWA